MKSKVWKDTFEARVQRLLVFKNILRIGKRW